MKKIYGATVINDDVMAAIEKLASQFTLGRHDLSAVLPKMYANAEEYESRPDGPYESHELYIDVQCVIEGEEIIELCPVTELHVETPYDKTRDITFYDGGTPCTEAVTLHAGEYCIIPPGMGHKPCLDVDGSHHVKKIVVKIPVR